MAKNPRIGSSFESFLAEQGIADAVNAHAIKRVIAWQIGKAMEERRMSKAELARRMRTSRAQLDRLLDPKNDRVQLDTVQRAASALGRRLRVELV
jgi:DNA-binding Xre family transcriptional regulator